MVARGPTCASLPSLPKDLHWCPVGRWGRLWPRRRGSTVARLARPGPRRLPASKHTRRPGRPLAPRHLAPTRIARLYTAYKDSKKDPAKARSQEEWWGIAGKRSGVRHTIEGSLGEYQADKLFAAQGHTKLSHGGKLLGLLEKPQGPGLDGVWCNATPPPEFIITETKTTTQPGDNPRLSKGQMSNAWVLRGKRLSRAVGEKQAKQIQLAMLKGQVSKRVLHIDHTGMLTQYSVDAAGKMALLT